MSPIRLTDLTFHTNSGYPDTASLLDAQRASLLYVDAIKKRKVDLEVIKHVSKTTTILPQTGFFFFISNKRTGHIPRQTFQRLRAFDPHVVIVHGFHFPWHLLRLRYRLPGGTRLVLWHHADRAPAHWASKLLYRWMDRCISRYLFTSAGNAAEWIAAGIIRNRSKIAELPPTLTDFSAVDKSLSREKLGFNNGVHYLWVGRLDPVKDPITVLQGFAAFAFRHPGAQLHLVYQGGSLLPQVEKLVGSNVILRRAVHLHGRVNNAALPAWYSAADFFISGSEREAGSVTLLEAMACGCIPIITAIPPSLQVTGNGQHAIVYPVGDAAQLDAALQRSSTIDRTKMSEEIVRYFKKEYAADAVAAKLHAICVSALGE